MTPDEYCELANRTCADLEGKPLAPGMADALHMVIGMVTEVGEIADIYKRAFAYGKEVDDVHVKEELGDAMWYIGALCRKKGWSLEEIMLTNIAKLQARYPDKFTQEAAINRNLGREREILEGGK